MIVGWEDGDPSRIGVYIIITRFFQSCTPVLGFSLILFFEFRTM